MHSSTKFSRVVTISLFNFVLFYLFVQVLVIVIVQMALVCTWIRSR